MRVTICDVGPRDGLQNESAVLEPSARAELVNRLAETGLPRIEVASFVHPDRVPQMADAEEVVRGIDRREGVVYAGLVLNEKGYERLAASELDEVHYSFGATESFNRRNANASVQDSVAAAERIAARAGADGLPLVVSISVAFGCPFEGRVPPERVLELVERVVAAGAEEVVLADTIGVAVPRQVRHLVAESTRLGRRVGIHLHNTRNTGFANAYAALQAGATLFDASVGGLGGCPLCPAGDRQHRDRGSRLPPQRGGRRDGSRPRGARRRVRMARGGPRPRASGAGVPRGRIPGGRGLVRRGRAL